MWSFPAKYIIDHSNTTPNIDHPFIEPNHQYHKLSVISVVTTSKPTLQQTDPTKREGAFWNIGIPDQDSNFASSQKHWTTKNNGSPSLNIGQSCKVQKESTSFQRKAAAPGRKFSVETVPSRLILQTTCKWNSTRLTRFSFWSMVYESIFHPMLIFECWVI